MKYLFKDRVPIAEAKKKSFAKVAGWIKSVRRIGQLIFMILKDYSGEIQITLKKDKVDNTLWEKAQELGKEDVIVVEGEVCKSNISKIGYELFPKTLEIISRANRPLPIEYENVNTGLDKRLDYRFLDLRNERVRMIFEVRNVVLNAFREFFIDNGFFEINTSKIVGQATEGGANVFKIKYFDRDAYLAQSPQFYKQMMMATGIEKVWEIGPVYRAEPHYTTRHLCEYWSADFEMAFIDSEEDIMNVLEDLFIHTIKRIIKECKDILEVFNIDLKIPEKPFPRIPMYEAYKILEENFNKYIPYGEDLDPEGERLIYTYVKEKYNHEFVFITDFPWNVRPFYTMKKDETWTRSFDLLFRGLEVTTGGQREHRYEILVKQCKEKGLDPKDFEFYLEFFKYGMPPHGGSGTGIERVVKQILGLNNVRECVLLPRDPERVIP